jgi:hypothetical protein
MLLQDVEVGMRIRWPLCGKSGTVKYQSPSGTSVILDNERSADVYAGESVVEVLGQGVLPEPKKRRVRYDKKMSCGLVERGNYMGVRAPKCWHGHGCPKCWKHYQRQRAKVVTEVAQGSVN